MELQGLHVLLTYRCDAECDHCFVWGSPKTRGVFTLHQVKDLLSEAKKLPTVRSVSFEGGEPFLYYPLLAQATREAAAQGFRVELLSNGYWATCPEDAVDWLRPLSLGSTISLTLSSDLYHGDRWDIDAVKNAVHAAKAVHMPVEIIAIKHPTAVTVCPQAIAGAKVGLYDLMYKGRAATQLTSIATTVPWDTLTKCPYEDLVHPKRVHVDPFGYVHVCQGITIGNAWTHPFSHIIQNYAPHTHPIIDPLVRGGPVALVKAFAMPHERRYADACHLCYATRCVIRPRFPDLLAPDEMYGVSS